MNKHLIYYFTCDSEEIYEVYKLHFSCINAYNDIFYKYTFILGFNNLDDNKFINYWKNIIIENINTNKDIEFIIVKNDSERREALHFYNEIFAKLESFKNELILWGHSKRDFGSNKQNIYQWITFCHNQLSYIDEIENYLVYDKYCHIGSLLLHFIKGLYCNNHYCGAFYWLYPDKILYKLKKEYQQINKHIQILINYNHSDNNEAIKYFAESWFNLFFDIKDFKAMYQKNYIPVYTFAKDKLYYIYPFLPYNKSISMIKSEFEDILYNDWIEYHNTRMNELKLNEYIIKENG